MIDDKNCFYRDINVISTKTIEWLKSQALKKPKYSDIVMLTNLNYIVTNLEKVTAMPIRELVTKSHAMFRKHSSEYVAYLFCY
jgi:hypothetical protein